jgi:hypothetical protein
VPKDIQDVMEIKFKKPYLWNPRKRRKKIKRGPMKNANER